MHDIPSVDPGREIDWGKTSQDYADHRPGPPSSLYDRIQALGYAQEGTSLLDLGTGTGIIAREFARRNLNCTGIDISEGQIEIAKKLAVKEGLSVDFQWTAVEDASFEENQFSTIIANQCWLYFDKNIAIPFVKKWLNQGGVLITSHFCWLPRLDEIARESEQLILKYNPSWSASDWSGEIPPFPEWAKNDFILKAMFTYDVPIPFTQESWRGRIRACRGIGAALTEEEVREFDEEHKQMLESRTGEEFQVLHRIDAHIYEPR